jgi:lipoprotein-releasing system ATP-binding protein
MIKVERLIKNFDKLNVLKGIDIEVKKGEIVSVVGPSGAGKTTMLQIIGTLMKPDSGSIYINDQDITQLKGKRLADFRNKNIGFVFQFHNLLPEFTALENICIPAYISGKKSKKEILKSAEDLLKFLNLSERADHKPGEMSGGEQQRVAVARALINNPAVVLADEPSGNLDTENKQALHKLFFALRDQFRQTFVIVTHNDELAQMSDRVIHLVDGKVINNT